MQTPAVSPRTGPSISLGRPEFIALAASLMALNAMAIDIILPALQQIGAALGVVDENTRQYIISAYVVGLGAGQLIFGPISDRFGRRLPLFVGLALYVCVGVAAATATGIGWMLALRFVQGLAAATTRVIAISAIRDMFGGRQMAEILSLVMMVFMIIPVIAPALGQLIMVVGDWPTIFFAIALLGAIITVWAVLRMPETLPPERRRPLTLKAILGGFGLVLGNRIAFCYMLASTSMFGALFGFINSAQQIYTVAYPLADWFPFLFALGAGLMAVSSFTNARLVGRFGMRRLSHGALIGFIAITGLWTMLAWLDYMPFALFFLLFSAAMFQFGWIGANFNAIAMEPLGHVAGTAAATQGFVTTLGGGILGAAIGQAFDGSTLPLATGYLLVGIAALALVVVGERCRLFQIVSDIP